MTIPASMPSRVVYLGDGVTVNFPLPFKYFANADGTKQLKVYLADKTGENEAVLVENKDFKLSSAGEVNGTLTMNIAPATAQKLTVVFDIPLEQPTDWEEFGRLPSESIEESFDRVTSILKQQNEVIERCVKVTASGNQAPQELLDEVYEKLDSASEIAGTAIAAANEAATAADNATAAVASAEQTLADVTQYVNLSKTDIQNTRNEAVNTIDLAVVDAKSSLAETVNDAESSIENTIMQAVSEAKEQAIAAATETISTAKENIDTYVSDSIKPDLQSYVADAAESAQSAKASASVAESSKTIAELSKTAAESAADLAKQYRDEAKDFVQPTQATEEKLGLVKIATAAEVVAGVDNVKIVTPATAAAQYQSKTAAEAESDRIINVTYTNLHSKLQSCVLEIPQNINLDFDNGTMTLKAGSKIPFLTGSGAVDITVPADLTTYSYGAGSDDGYWLVSKDGKYLRFSTYFNTYVGTEQPSASASDVIWFDTTRQKVFYATSKLDFSEEISLPFCYVSRKGGIITKIKHIFNGLGFIGNACWYDKGIKVLMFNGRNPDGTLRNKEFITGSFVWQQTSYNGELQFSILESGNNGQILTTRPNYIFVGQNVPFEKSSIWIDPQTNISRFSLSAFTEWQINPLAVLGKITCDGTRIIGIEANQPVALVDEISQKTALDQAVYSRMSPSILEAPNGGAYYTGKTLTLRAGLKVLIPNGRDGGNNRRNIIFRLPHPVTVTRLSTNRGENKIGIDLDGTIVLPSYNRYFEQDTPPTPSASGMSWWYNPSENNIYSATNGSAWALNNRTVFIGYMHETDEAITVLDLDRPASLVTLADMEKLISGETNYFKLRIPGQTLPLLVQFGKVEKGGSGLNDVTVTYPVAFSTTNRSVLKCMTEMAASGTAYWTSVSVRNETNSSFTAQRDKGFGFNWIAIGY